MTEVTSPGDLRRRWPFLAIGAAGALIIGLTGGAWALREVSRACQGTPMTITVAVQPEIGPAAREIAARFNVQVHEVRGRCVRVEVVQRDPAVVARMFAGRSTIGGPEAIDGWLPESWVWLYLARSTPAGARLVPFGGDSVASSPLVLATSAATAAELRRRKIGVSWELFRKGDADGLSLSRRMLDPAASAAGVSTLMAAQTLDSKGLPGLVGAMESRSAVAAPAMFTDLTTLTRDQRSLLAATEQQVVAYDDAHQPNPALALAPEEGTLSLDYPFAVLAVDPARREAAEAFRAALLSRVGQDALQNFGFRTPQGVLSGEVAQRYQLSTSVPKALVPADAGKAVITSVHEWTRLSPRLRLLVLLDASGSMLQRTSDGRTRLEVAARTLRAGLRLLPDGTWAGLWSVATSGTAGAAAYRELVPLAPLAGGADRTGSAADRTGSAAAGGADRIGSAAARVRPGAGTGTGLYDGVLAAYHQVRESHLAASTDIVLVLTDGDDDIVRLRGLYDAVRAQQDPRRPVQIVTVAFGPEGTGSEELKRVGELTGGGLHATQDPARLGLPFEEALAPNLCTLQCIPAAAPP